MFSYPEILPWRAESNKEYIRLCRSDSLAYRKTLRFIRIDIASRLQSDFRPRDNSRKFFFDSVCRTHCNTITPANKIHCFFMTMAHLGELPCEINTGTAMKAIIPAIEKK